MLLVLALVVVVVGLAGAGLLGIGVFSAASGQRRSGLAAVLTAPVAIVVVLLVLAVLVVGGRGGGGGGDGGDHASPRDETARSASQASSTIPSARVNDVAAGYRPVLVRATERDSFLSNPPVGGLAPDEVVQVLAVGFGSFERGVADQCVVELGRQTACTSSAVPVQFDEDGSAAFLFVVRGDVAPGGCRVAQATCLLRVRGADSRRQGRTQTAVGDGFAYGQTRVTPEHDVTPGGTVEVAVTGFPAGTTATALVCAPTDVYDARRCSTPADGSAFALDQRGAGRSSLVIPTGPVGTDGVRCGARRGCAVVVVVGAGFVVPGASVPVGFARGAGASYSSERVLPGLALVVVLMGIAIVLWRRTDWTKPTEAATPELDEADLRSDQDLDTLFGTDEEIDERDPIPG